MNPSRRRGSVPPPKPWMHEFVRRPASRWGVRGLTREVTVENSPLLRRSLGRVSVTRSRVRLSIVLLDAPRELICEVFAHDRRTTKVRS